MGTKGLQQNIIKNLIAIVMIGIAYPIFYYTLRDIDKTQVGDFLIVISILFIAVQFIGFSFSYKDVTGKRSLTFGHIVTFFAMLLTGFLLEVMVIVIQIAYPQFFSVIAFLSVLIYLSVLLYDFWDFLKLIK